MHGVPYVHSKHFFFFIFKPEDHCYGHLYVCKVFTIYLFTYCSFENTGIKMAMTLNLAFQIKNILLILTIDVGRNKISICELSLEVQNYAYTKISMVFMR